MADETKPAAKPAAPTTPAPVAAPSASEVAALRAKVAELEKPLAAKSAPSAPVDPTGDGPGVYRVSWNGKEWSGHARDSAEAWALFSDSIKAWPGPKVKDRVIERISA